MYPPPSGSSPGEQRRASRLRVNFPARYASANLTLEGSVTDLSHDGLFFCADYLDDQGQAAQVWVEIPARGQTLELRGEVRWVNDGPHGSGMGIRFIDVSWEDRQTIGELGAASAGAIAFAAHPSS